MLRCYFTAVSMRTLQQPIFFWVKFCWKSLKRLRADSSRLWSCKYGDIVLLHFCALKSLQHAISEAAQSPFVIPSVCGALRYLFVKFTPVYSSTFCGDQTADARHVFVLLLVHLILLISFVFCVFQDFFVAISQSSP